MNFNYSIKNAVSLGDAWSGNTINNVIFRNSGIISHDCYQTTAFYVDKNTIRFARRNLNNGYVDFHDLKGNYNIKDSHNSISLGLDRDNCIHVSYDHRVNKLHYRRGLYPNSINHWTSEIDMTSSNEDRVTYPSFINPNKTNQLSILYRDGIHCRGVAFIKFYDEKSLKWSAGPMPIFSGIDDDERTSNAYWNTPCVGNDGSVHLAYVWRIENLGRENLVNNINICYTYSPTGGDVWLDKDNKIYTLPITRGSSDVIRKIKDGENLINQSGMCLDSMNRPHIVFYSNDKKGIPQFQHVWFNGRKWKHQYIPNFNEKFKLRGGGTLKLPIGRPQVIIDRHDRVYAIYRKNENFYLSKILEKGCGRFLDNEKITAIAIKEYEVGFSEPVIDHVRWSNHNILSLIIQKTHQSDGDIDNNEMYSPVYLIDLKINNL